MYQIEWSKTALSSYQNAWDFILLRWSLDVVIELDDKVQELLKKITTQKNLCPPLRTFPSLRKCVISRQTSLVYSIDEKTKSITIISFVDNRMDHSF